MQRTGNCLTVLPYNVWGEFKLHTLGTPKGTSPLGLVQLVQMC